ncbi:MAG: carbohydrate-binding domain-containing protein, partial [Bacteroidales bacterium]|nr:carbohydrate-binding domain-containing protein [Candidatus Physcousia equi]
ALFMLVGNEVMAQYRGDMNNDGRISLKDLALLTHHLKTGGGYTAVSDVNADGVSNLKDIDKLVDILMGRTSPTTIVDTFDGLLSVTWNGDEEDALVSGLPADGSITAVVNGGDVVVQNSRTDMEVNITLQGESNKGSLVYTGDYKTTFLLNGLKLKGSSQEAINVKCGKRIALRLVAGTENTLEDADEDGGQKAALYTKGHLEVSGAGKLYVRGHAKHGISAKEYIEIKKSVGTIAILQASGDGIHAGQYYLQQGGEVTIDAVGGDGIQAEATDNVADTLNGQLIIKDGNITITTTGNDVAAIKSDSLMSISGGKLNLTTSGAGNKAIKSKQELKIDGGDITINQSGKAVVENGDMGYVGGLKGTDLSITNGTISITTSGVGARGISAGNLTVADNASITIVNNGAAGTASDAVDVSSTTTDTDTPTEKKSYKVYVNVPTSSGMGGFPGQSTSVWSTVYLYSSSGTQVATLTQQVTVNGTTFYCYDFATANSGTYYFQAPNYRSGGGGSTTYTIKSGTFTAPSDGADHFYKVSSTYSTSGTTRTYSLSDVSSSYQGGTIGSSSTTDTFTAKGIKVDGDLNLLGGTIDINVSGSGGKGIKVDGNFVEGNIDGSGPVLNITTTGSQYGSTGGTSTGGRPGMNESSGSSAKGIKVVGNITLYGGETLISTATNGAEGMESKLKATNAIRIVGGKHYLKCYDDCINSAGGITFEGGTTVCYGFGNDAVDSNYGQTGAIILAGGNLLTYTTKGSPEEGLDCDNNRYIKITGPANVVALGGAQGGGSSSGIGSASQGYVLSTSSLSIQPNRYYTLSNSSGQNLFTFSVEASLSSTMSLITAAGMSSGSTYTLKYSTSAPTDATTSWHGLYLGSSAAGSTSVTTFTAK